MTSAPTSREIRVFLSSTFRDMETERTYLIKQVFPRVRAACLARQVGFTEIDLRWGVTEEESKNGATVEICLKEIDRCRDFPPFFIGFLGERYGWIPRHDQLAAYWQQHADSPYAARIQDAVRREISVTELEMELGVLAAGAAEKLAGQALFLLRHPDLTDQLYRAETGQAPDPDDRRFYDPAAGRLEALKMRLRQTPYLGVDGYTRVEQFGQAIEDYLLAQLDRLFPADQVPSAFAQSNLAHAAFRFHRLLNFLTRPDVRQALLEALTRRLATPALGPILLTAPSGHGKSALMADLARHLEGRAGNVHWRVIDHYIGADAHNSLDAWVDRLLETLHPEIEDLTGPLPETSKAKQEALSTWLAYAARRLEQTLGKPVHFVLVLDALDQLTDGGKDVGLLRPEIIGPSATVICSAAADTPAQQAARDFEIIAVPPLTADLRASLITATLSRYRKGLAPELTATLAQAPQSGSPLFLTLALEELRLDARHESLVRTLGEILIQPDAEHLFLHAFLLDDDSARPEQPDLAVRFMALLGASRAGLTENELADLLALPEDPIAADTGKPRLPQVHLSRLLSNFQPFLLNKDGRRAPMHRLFGEAALAHVGAGEIREHLYAYFQPGYGTDWDDVDHRQASEALYQITQLTSLETEQHQAYRKRLVKDLGYLRVPANLYDIANEVTAEALMALTGEDKTELGERWQQDIEVFDLASVNQSSANIRGLAGRMQDMAYDQYRLPRRLAETLLTRQELLQPVDDPQLAHTMNQLGLLCHDMADYPPVRPLYERAMAIREQALGPMHPDTATSLNNLACYLQYTGDPTDFAAARPLYERALAIREQALDPTHPDMATSLNNLAGYLKYTGDPTDFAAARPLYERALTIREQALGPMHPYTAKSLNHLARYLNDTGHPADYAAARPLYERALTIREQALGPTHPETATSLNNLAVYLEQTGDPADLAAARPLYERALAITEESLGPNHPYTATSLNNLAGYLQYTGDPTDFAAARPLYERALAITEQSLGPNHPETATSLNNLAGYLKYTGDPADYAAARPLYERALAITEQSLGPNHPYTATSLNNLASYLNDTGHPADYAAARPLYERTLTIREQALGPTHPETATSLNNLAFYLNDTGDPADYAAARPLYERALAITEESLGPNHPETATSLNNLAFYLNDTGDPADYAAARPLYERALAITEESLGPNHPETATSLNNLAGYLKYTGDPADYAAARPLYERALAIREQALGPKHPDTVISISNLANFLSETGDPADWSMALPLYERALASLEETVGPDDQKALRIKQNFAVYLRKAERADDALPLIRDVVDRRVRLTGETSLETASALSALGANLQQTGDLGGAKDAYRKALAIRMEKLGPDDPATQLVQSRLDDLLA